MTSTDSSSTAARRAVSQPQLPPGFRFHPTDEELVVHYLKRRAQSAPLPIAIIADVDLYKFDPWELPAKAAFGEKEWYFFSPRDRKYPNEARPNRAASSGYWKATGTDKPVLTSGGTQKVGVKKALVFYGGKPPRGVKTDWIMHEYRLADHYKTSNIYNRPPVCNTTDKQRSLRLEEWVLCRIYKKNTSRQMNQERDSDTSCMSTEEDKTRPISKGLKPPLARTISYYNNNGMTNRMVGVGSSNEPQQFETNNHSYLTTSLPLGRTLGSLYWPNELVDQCKSTGIVAGEEGTGHSMSTKRMVLSVNSGDNKGMMGISIGPTNASSSSTMASLFGAQTTPLHGRQQPPVAMLGRLGEAVVFGQQQRVQHQELPELNWY